MLTIRIRKLIPPTFRRRTSSPVPKRECSLGPGCGYLRPSPYSVLDSLSWRRYRVEDDAEDNLSGRDGDQPHRHVDHVNFHVDDYCSGYLSECSE